MGGGGGGIDLHKIYLYRKINVNNYTDSVKLTAKNIHDLYFQAEDKNISLKGYLLCLTSPSRGTKSLKNTAQNINYQAT